MGFFISGINTYELEYLKAIPNFAIILPMVQTLLREKYSHMELSYTHTHERDDDLKIVFLTK
jgi:hypothetical protein